MVYTLVGYSFSCHHTADSLPRGASCLFTPKTRYWLLPLVLGTGLGAAGAQTLELPSVPELPSVLELPSAPEPAHAVAAQSAETVQDLGIEMAFGGVPEMNQSWVRGPESFALWLPDPNPAPKEGDREDKPIVVSMVRHPDGNLWWISGQANIILQGRLPFHSPYQGKNSFRNSAEYKTSMVGTLYTALRRNRSIRWNTDFIFDMESAGGRGLSEALGLAGFTNLDVVRNPNLGSTPYIARYQIHQTIGLSEAVTDQDPGQFALAPAVSVRRIELRVGR